MNTTMACRQIDEFINEALEGQSTIDDDTFMMESAVPLSTSSPIVTKALPPPPPAQPLMHSISIYRKRQQELKKNEDDATTFKTPQNLNILQEEDDESKEDLHDKIQTLEQQVVIQQKAIAQASKALNICESSFEFTNSTENVEGERLLLIACKFIHIYITNIH